MAVHECELCGDVFVSNVSDEQALAEAEAEFGPIPVDERAIVCDECYWAHTNRVN